ncbi:hypothetical protein PC119_g20080 [Phytophthora cactorum]|nr:hypothetical protein PC119_g20080 [Phytophthora cactorum]KAG4042235.1 hypothetical protein PC123_g22266 [Phytophthora cactorum]
MISSALGIATTQAEIGTTRRVDLRARKTTGISRTVETDRAIAHRTAHVRLEVLLDTQLNTAANAASSANKSMKPLHAERFKLGGPPTLTELENTGLPQSAEPAAETSFLCAFVGEAGRPEDGAGMVIGCAKTMVLPVGLGG